MLFYGVVSAQTEKVVEFFLEREAAEAMIGEVRMDEPMLAEDLRSRRSSWAQDRQEREARMAELLISSRRTSTSKDDLLSLMDRLNLAIPDAEPVLDKERVGPPFWISDETEGPNVGGDIMLAPDIVELVLPAVAGLTVKAAVDVTVDWLRGLRKKPIQGEKVVLIYGSRGEPLSKVRLRAGDSAPEVFAPPWPR